MFIISLDRRPKPMSCCNHAIQAESRSLFNDLNGEWGESCQTFNASRGWFEQFKWCSNLHNIKMAGEVDTQINRYLTLMKPGFFGNECWQEPTPQKKNSRRPVSKLPKTASPSCLLEMQQVTARWNHSLFIILRILVQSRVTQRTICQYIGTQTRKHGSLEVFSHTCWWQ